MKKSIVSIQNIEKQYSEGFKALQGVSIEIQEGEIFALLGPNGAGKTTLISIVCGISNATSGTITVDGADVVKEFRRTRDLIGLVPQELTTESFETVWACVKFSRGLFGKAPDPAYLEDILRKLSLWDKRNSKVITLSGGMKRRLLIAKALSHQPKVLFLDEPTAGVDVELRKDMWQLVSRLRESGVTIILTTHYIEEAEEIADRVGVISQGRILLVEEKYKLMANLGTKQLIVDCGSEVEALPEALKGLDVKVAENRLIYTYDPKDKNHSAAGFLETLKGHGIGVLDIQTKQSSLEEIFVAVLCAFV